MTRPLIKIAMVAILIGLFVIPLGSAASIHLTEKTGENYIRWTWDAPLVAENMIYVDGIFIKNGSINYYYLTDLKPMEEHRIAIYIYNPARAAASGLGLTSPEDIADLQEAMTSSTTMNSGLYYLLFGLLIFSTVISGLIRNSVKGLIFGILAIILAIVLSYLSAFFMDWLVLFSGVIGVVALIFTILHVQVLMKNTYIDFHFG